MILEEPTGLFPSITMKDRMFRAISLCLLSALLLGAADAPQKSAFDKPTLEAYVRHLYLLQPQLTVTISDPKPSALPGFKEVRVRIAQGAQFQEVPLYVSNDGKKIVQGNFYDVASNPFKPEIDKLKTQFQPALGTAGAPGAIVVFSDLPCPLRRRRPNTSKAGVDPLAHLVRPGGERGGGAGRHRAVQRHAMPVLQGRSRD